MFEQARTECLSIFFIIFSNYPMGTVPSIVRTQKENSPGRSGFPSYAQSILQANKSPILGSLRTGLGPEQGFDLSPEEYVKFKIWDKGEIPFYIDVPSFSDKSIRDRIRWFLNEVNSLTKLNFIELPRPPLNYNEKRWVYFLNRQSYLGCHDVSMANFTLFGVQRVVLGYDCLATAGGLAEIVLALAGVPPQHNAPNRDEYIEIIEDNIIPEKKYLFKKLGDQDWLYHDFDYDFESAGHFHQHKHSVNGGATYMIQNGYRELNIGMPKGFTEMDIYKINVLYTYIVEKTKNYMPACKKLFDGIEDTNKMFESSKNLQPLPKPNKYLGIEDASDKEEIGFGAVGIPTDENNHLNTEQENEVGKGFGTNTEGENISDKNSDDNVENDIHDNKGTYIYTEGENKSEKSNYNNAKEENKSVESNTGNTEGENKNEDGNTIDSVDGIQSNEESLNDGIETLKYDKTENDLLYLKGKSQKSGSYKDPLTYLSDYQTGDDRKKRMRI